jgi:hypothetical protein
MRLKQEILTYAKLLDGIGDKVISASNKIKIVSEDNLSIAELKPYYEILQHSLNEYKICQKQLLSVKSPIVINNEHQELIESFNGFVSATETLINSVNLNTMEYNKEEFRRGLTLLTIAEVSIKVATDNIVNKVTK